jgi:phosphopantetheinyl transferase (holo-ACP synthase)
MIVGVGIDVVEIARLASGLARTQRLAIRLFTERERDLPGSVTTAAWRPLLSSPKAGQTRQRA